MVADGLGGRVGGADLGVAYLCKEGLFVRAYNEGAYAFIHQALACKAMRRFVKSAGPIGRFAGFRLPCMRLGAKPCHA